MESLRPWRCGVVVSLLVIHAWVRLLPCASAKPLPSSHSPPSATRYFHFNIEWKKVTRLCHTKPILTVNGRYPGPTIAVREGDRVVVKVTNSVARNTTIHWHGIKQFRTCWADGPAYITQCPIQSKHSYTYRFKVDRQRGTLLWHAHLAWQRATVHGAFIIHPKKAYPFHAPIHAEVPLIFGEWWISDVEAVEEETVLYGGGPNVSDAYTINGLPGPLYPCSTKDTFVQEVEPGKTYMLRLINAALNGELFFAVANHSLTVVEADAAYVKPFSTPAVMLAPGQTTTVLLTANYHYPHSSIFAMAIRPYVTAVIPFDATISVGLIRYKHKDKAAPATEPELHATEKVIPLPANLPPPRDTPFATSFDGKLRSLASRRYPCNVPRRVDVESLLAISLNLQDCCPSCTCKGLNGNRYAASINNQSFLRPPVSVLHSYLADPRGFASRASTFPLHPPHAYNYTGDPPRGANMNAVYGSGVMSIPYGAAVEMVFQDTSLINAENHPVHVHGHNFFVVGRGFGDFDKRRDRKGYNLVDPPERNTVAVPSGGWAAVRFRADNPGVWFVHCHLEVHTTWGLAMAFVVEDGPGKEESMFPPPADLPRC